MHYEVTKIVESSFILDLDSPYHGRPHWARVLTNGLKLALHSGADPLVVEYFALLHDSRRYNEDEDSAHGERAAVWARALHNMEFPGIRDLTMKQIRLLETAIKGHSDGHTTNDPTIGTCWDADRLDLGRVGIMPVPRLLSTESAKEWLLSQPQLFAPKPRAAQKKAHGETAPAPGP